jgi:hypothetical protein
MPRPMSAPDRRATAAALTHPSSRSTDGGRASRPELRETGVKDAIKRAVSPHHCGSLLQTKPDAEALAAGGPTAAEEKWAVSKWPSGAAPGPERSRARELHPGLMRQFQSRLSGPLRLKQSHKSHLSKLRRYRPVHATFMRPLAPCQQCQGVPSQAHEVPRSRNSVPISRMQHVVLFQPSQGGWAGARSRARRKGGRPKLMGNALRFSSSSHGDGRPNSRSNHDDDA